MPGTVLVRRVPGTGAHAQEARPWPTGWIQAHARRRGVPRWAQVELEGPEFLPVAGARQPAQVCFAQTNATSRRRPRRPESKRALGTCHPRRATAREDMTRRRSERCTGSQATPIQSPGPSAHWPRRPPMARLLAWPPPAQAFLQSVRVRGGHSGLASLRAP